MWKPSQVIPYQWGWFPFWKVDVFTYMWIYENTPTFHGGKLGCCVCVSYFYSVTPYLRRRAAAAVAFTFKPVVLHALQHPVLKAG